MIACLDNAGLLANSKGRTSISLTSGISLQTSEPIEHDPAGSMAIQMMASPIYKYGNVHWMRLE